MTAPASKSAKSVPKSATKAPPPRSEPQVDKDNTRASRKRYPSDKVAAQRKYFIILSSKFFKILLVRDQQEADVLKAQKAERRAFREKKALQKANERVDMPSDGEGEYEPRDSPTVCFS
jgi:hypothetical protein